MIPAAIPVPGPLRVRSRHIPISGSRRLRSDGGTHKNGESHDQKSHQFPPAHGGTLLTGSSNKKAPRSPSNANHNNNQARQVKQRRLPKCYDPTQYLVLCTMYATRARPSCATACNPPITSPTSLRTVKEKAPKAIGKQAVPRLATRKTTNSRHAQISRCSYAAPD